MKNTTLPFNGFAVQGPEGVLLSSISETREEAQLKGADLAGGRPRAKSYGDLIEAARAHWENSKKKGYSIVKITITEQGNG
jgi:hypothetical protein